MEAPYNRYVEVFMIINMIDDYVRLLREQESRSIRCEHMIEKFEGLSRSLAEQINLDKEKMWKKCSKKTAKHDTITSANLNLFER